MFQFMQLIILLLSVVYELKALPRHHMEKKMRHLEKKFLNFEDMFKDNQSKNQFKIGAADNAIVRLKFPEAKNKNRANIYSHNSKNQIQYFLNFDFKNYRNPKEPTNVRVKQSPSPFNVFPLKGEDVFP
ncbi:uncharacterized protein LOC133838942 [Drosophila sulfurigaster albostrigata]|uniref:uncharacterized protein LOC133838942 n=1 Tax=Drosophila sulfurigaster albostrigata TaxID=89887 RepID=UPI002D21CA4B|nr:uncharacterized protein LOC133838942 [Drosophila sulfurigaster albostrigata]